MNTLLKRSPASKSTPARRGTARDTRKLENPPSPPDGVRYHLDGGVCRGVWIDGIYVRIQGDGRMILENL